MKKETYAAPVMEIVLLEREKTVLTSECEGNEPGNYCPGVECTAESSGCANDCVKYIPCFADDCPLHSHRI